MKRLVCAAALFAAIIDARPARACDWIIERYEIVDAPLPFEGAQVPTNASLRLGQILTRSDVTVFLNGPEDVERQASIERDEYGDRLVLDGDLTPGEWLARFVTLDATRFVAFTVIDSRDERQPSIPTLSHTSEPPVFFECGGISARVAERFDYDDTAGDGDIAWFVVGSRVEPVLDGAASITFFDGVDAPDVFVIDHAGNVSPIVGEGEGGCASMPASTAVPTSLLAALLLLGRRRRAIISMGQRQ